MVSPLGEPHAIFPTGGGMTSGRETLGQIEQAIADLRSKEQLLQRELEEITNRRAKLMDDRISAYRELAEVRARHAVSDGVIDEADRLSHRVERLLSARQNTIRDLKKRLADADKQRADLIEQRDELSFQIEQFEAGLDRLALQAREALSSDPEYRQELERLERAATTHTKAAEKAKRAEQDQADKGRAYENDPLFMYLWQRQYGTREYQAKGLIRWLDGKVADLVKYQDARANYAVLNEIPGRLNEHVERLASELQAAQKIVDDRETAMIRSMAKEDLPKKLREAHRREKDIHVNFEQVTGELSDLGEQLNAYAEGQDAAFKKAIEMSAEFLGQRRTSELMQLARATEGRTDDEIASRIADLDRTIASVSSDIDTKTKSLEDLFEKRDELVRVAADFRRARYDDRASVFRGRDVGTILLQELIRGAITGAEYWARSRSRHSRRKRPADSYRRSESFPPFDEIFGGIGDDWDDVFDDDNWSFGDDDFGTGGRF